MTQWLHRKFQNVHEDLQYGGALLALSESLRALQSPLMVLPRVPIQPLHQERAGDGFPVLCRQVPRKMGIPPLLLRCLVRRKERGGR